MMFLRRQYILAAALAQIAVCFAVTQEHPHNYVPSDGPIQLNNSVSSDVINETNIRSEMECSVKCSERGCAAVSVTLSSRICQLLIINDASQSPGPIGSHVRRALGSEADAKVWKVEDFDDVLRKRRLMNLTIQFQSSSSGRNGSTKQFVVGVTGCYRIVASGGAGGSNSFTGKLGGRGAVMSGSFNLTAGTRLSIVVGQAGGNAANNASGSGGGGGSFVYRTEDSWLYLAAGAGGGASVVLPGLPGQVIVNGTDSNGAAGNDGFGGANGNPGRNSPSATSQGFNHGGCGAGWLGKPVNPRRGSNDGDGGGSLADGWIGGRSGGNINIGHGGFGGGGGPGFGADDVKGAAGAGGGFSGGGAGVGGLHSGGGGGSFCSGSGCGGTVGGNAGDDNGLVVLKLLYVAGD